MQEIAIRTGTYMLLCQDFRWHYNEPNCTLPKMLSNERCSSNNICLASASSYDKKDVVSEAEIERVSKLESS